MSEEQQDGLPEQAPARNATSYPVTDFKLENHPLDDVRALKVAVVGAGLSGILTGILLPVKVPGIDLTIFEKNSDVVSPFFALPTILIFGSVTCSSGWYVVRKCLPWG